jgi:DNA repair protein RecN (Recombination protein N)
MLESLHIRNFALIDDLVLPWKPGLNVLTGETGAGKSIIVDAMSLLLGERAATTFIRKGSTRADIEALFDISHHVKIKDFLESKEFESSTDEIVLRRVISAGGKSKCFLNGSIVTRNILSKAGALLVDMHGQHEHQSLMQPGKHLSLLDDFAGLRADVALVQQAYQDLRQNISALERIIARESSRNERISDLEQDLALLDKADLKEGEEEGMRSRRNLIANSEKIHRLASEGYDMLFSGETYQPPVVNTWDSIMQVLREIAKVDDNIRQPLKEYEEIQFKFDELAQMLQSYISELEYDAAELEALENRLETISTLKRRYGHNTLGELLDHKKRMQEEYDRITGSSAERIELEGEVDRLRGEISKDAFVLSQKRREAADRLERNILHQLRDLGMKKAKFEVSIHQEQVPDGLIQHKKKSWKIWGTGVDKVEFLFSANVGEPLKPLRAIASGGEISRIMLAIRTVLAETDKVPVVIFDEIDSGVGGSMGMTIAEKLVSVSQSQQVICVTHLPQIAAMAENHVVVDKYVEGGRTRTEVEYPTGDDRAQEIARMLGGEATGEITLRHAEELLALAQKNQ